MSRAVCRVCLAADDVRMYNIDDCLLGIYEKLTSAKLSSGDEEHNTLCYICYSQLRKCQRFSNMAHRSERYLRDVLESDTKVTKKMVYMLNLPRVRTLSVQTLRPMYLDGQSKCKISKPIFKKKIITAVNNVPTIKKDINNVRLFNKENTREVFTVKIETPEEGFIKNESSKGLIEKQSTKKGFIEIESTKGFIEKDSTKKGLIEIESTKGFIEKEYIKEGFIKKEISTEEELIKNEVNEEGITEIEVELIKNEELTREVTKKPPKRPYKNKTERYNKDTTHCHICKKTFSTSSVLAKHMISHGDRPYICDYCGHSVRIKQHLIEHMRTHTGEKVYCKVCNKGLTQRVSLWRHMFIHTGEKPYCCHICGKSFNQSCQMRSHIRIIHEGVRSHCCAVCNKRFPGKSGWARHMESHSGEKAYSCDRCYTKFTTKNSKRRHMKHYCK